MRTKKYKQPVRIEESLPGPDKVVVRGIPVSQFSGVATGNFLNVLPSHRTGLARRQMAVLQMQQSHGNAYVQRQLSSTGEVNDEWPESDIREGDYGAQTSHDGSHAERLAQRLEGAMGGGEYLHKDLRFELEKGLGADLSQVRVHTDGEADHLSQSFEATAFATGSDIFFRKGAYGPDTDAGFHLLAHEVAHVVQQTRNPLWDIPGTTGPLAISQPSDRSESEASAAADRITAGESANVQAAPSAPVARQEDELGTLAGIFGLANDVVGSSSGLATGLGGLTSGIGLVTGAMDLFGGESVGERVGGGMSVAGGLSGLVGTASSLFGSGSLAVGGASGLSATMGAATSAGGAGLASMGAGALATSAGAVLGAGAAGYGLGSLIAEHTGVDEAIGEGLFDVLGPGPGLWLADTFGL